MASGHPGGTTGAGGSPVVDGQENPRRGRRRAALLLVSFLAVSALASLVTGGLVALERMGLIRLTRVPRIEAFTWREGDRRFIAAINSDVVGGAFVLSSGPRNGIESAPLWIRPRCLVIRELQGDVVALEPAGDFRRGGPHDRYIRESTTVPTIVERGTPVSFVWGKGEMWPNQYYVLRLKRSCQDLVPDCGFAFVSQKGMTFLSKLGDDERHAFTSHLAEKSRPDWETIESPGDAIFDESGWNLVRRSFETVVLETVASTVDIDTSHAAPGLHEVDLHVYSLPARSWPGNGEVFGKMLLVIDPDMTVDDERDSNHR